MARAAPPSVISPDGCRVGLSVSVRSKSGPDMILPQRGVENGFKA